MHVLSDGSISPNKCSVCETEFGGIDKGEERNTFVIVVKTKKSTTVANQEAEEKPKAKKVTVKSHKESFKVWKDSKDS